MTTEMTAKEYKIKLNSKNASSYQILRAMSDTMFNSYEIWNAAKAIQWTIRTGRISALKEKEFDELSGNKTINLIFKIAKMSNEITLQSASQEFIKAIA